MNTSSLKLLYQLLTGPSSVHQLSHILGLSERRVQELTKELRERGLLASKGDRSLEISSSLGGTLLRSLSSRYDLRKILLDAGEQVLASILSERDIVGIQRYTRLSYPTIRRALSRLMEAGAVQQIEEGGAFRLKEGDPELYTFVMFLREQHEAGKYEGSAEVVYSTPETVLKTIPKGDTASGSLTAFSAFSQWNIELRTVRDYRIFPELAIGPEDALVHALAFSKSRADYTDCLLFYLKNRNILKHSKLRELGRSFHVSDAVFDLETFARTGSPEVMERFLPENEIYEKAKLYDINLSAIREETPYEDFVADLSTELITAKPPSLFIFGGEAMRQKGLKRATKDIDIVLENVAAFSLLRSAILNLGYVERTNTTGNGAHRERFPRGVFVHDSLPTIDVFTKRILDAFSLTPSMISRSACRKSNNLSVCLLSNEDIFLLKSITEREGDLYDMAILAATPGFDWKVVLNELLRQEEKASRHFCLAVMQGVEEIERRNGIRTTIHRALESHCLDASILLMLEIKGPLRLNDMLGVLEYPEYTVRRHANGLVKAGKLSRDQEDRYSIKNRKRKEK